MDQDKVSAQSTNLSTDGLTKKEKFKKEAKSITLIVISVLIFRSVFFEPFRIPSGSMIPTLMIGDFILVNKFAYGFKLPFSDISLFGIDSDPIYLFGESKPSRGDVVVFKYPSDPSINYIKRVVGLPGDSIEIREKRVFINDQPLDQMEIDGREIMSDMDEKFKNYNLKFYKSKTGEHDHFIQQDVDNYYKTDYEKKIIPEGQYFVMGDNRDFSYDSRFWGYVDHKLIKGEAILVWFSLIFPFGEDSFKFRPWRIGEMIN
ncbi:MAG: signal peptidase I [Halobacteriovorax sp.]|nr:signal peptidase I [Halobacteriovorax sp.]